MRKLIHGALFSALTLAMATVANAQDGKLYKWVDEDGNVSYQDTPPPGSGRQVETFASQGAASPPAPQMPDADVVLYSIEVCDACDLVRNVLQERGIPFEEKNADNNVEVQAEIKELSGILSVPVLTIDGQVLTGYNKELILNELEETGFPIDAQAAARGGSQQRNANLGRDDLENMTPEQVEQAARDAALRGEDNDLFEEDEGFATLNDDIFNEDDGPGGDDISELEEIPEDERIQINQ